MQRIEPIYRPKTVLDCEIIEGVFCRLIGSFDYAAGSFSEGKRSRSKSSKTRRRFRGMCYRMDTSIEEEDDIDQAEQIKASSDSQETSKGKASVSIEVDWEELSHKNLEHQAPISSINHAMHKCSSEFLVSTGALEVFFFYKLSAYREYNGKLSPSVKRLQIRCPEL